MNKNLKKIDREFRHFGGLSLKYRCKCIGMLPEIFRNKIHIKKGYGTIEEYAARFAGISHKQTRLTLNLDKRYEDKPDLREALVQGEVSLSKLARVASVATVENQEELASKAKILSKSALDVFVKDVKMVEQKIENGLFEAKNVSKSLPGQKLKLDEDIENELLELQNKGINVNDLLRQMLAKRKQEIAEEKEKLAEQPAKSRYVPVRIKKVIMQEHGTQCSINNCQKPSTEIHHTRRWTLSKSHDPRFLAPLCKEHHQIAHSIDVKYHEKRI